MTFLLLEHFIRKNDVKNQQDEKQKKIDGCWKKDCSDQLKDKKRDRQLADRCF